MKVLGVIALLCACAFAIVAEGDDLPLLSRTIVGNRERFEFALKFESFPAGDTNDAFARSQGLVTKFEDNGGLPVFRLLQGGTVPDTTGAQWKSVLVNMVGNEWSESGNITFIDANAGSMSGIYFESPGLTGTQLGDFADLQYGCITYNITGGFGSLGGVYGTMVDTFVSNNPANPSAPFEINAWGIFFQDQ